MGCAHSQNNRNYFKRTNDSNLSPHEKKFKAVNVDDAGNEISICEIEITMTEILLRKNDGTILGWPLRLVRRYGHDKNLFSFECGRRCKTGAGIYAFKCDEAEEIFMALKSAIENCPKVTGNAYIIDQINLKEKANQMAYVNNNIMSSNSQIINNNQFINNPSISQFSNHSIKLNNNFPTNLPPNHFYANDVHGYMNSEMFDNGFVPNENSPLPVTDAELEEGTNFNYTQLDNLQLNIKNEIKTDLLTSDKSKLIDDENNIQEAIKKLDKNDKFRNEHQEINYTTLDLNPLDNRQDLENGSEGYFVSTAPPTPVHKFAKYNDFKTPNSVPTSPASTIYESTAQQYSIIDFDKTKALTGIINDKERNE